MDAATLPFSVLGPLDISLGRYELEEPWGRLVEIERASERVSVPLAEAGSRVSDAVGRATAIEIRSHVIKDRITRSSTFLCKTTEEAISLARFLEAHVGEMRRWLQERMDAELGLSTHAKLREVETHVSGPDCRVNWAFTAGDAAGHNLTARNAAALTDGYVMEHAPATPLRATLARAATGGKTVLAECTLRAPAEAPTEPASAAPALAALFAATGQDLASIGPSSRAESTARQGEGGLNVSIRLPELSVGTVGGGTGLPHAREALELMDCAGEGQVYRLAQICGAVALAAEIGLA
jgi:hydroxymethylglutaryl-CoA reductase (NADPH)